MRAPDLAEADVWYSAGGGGDLGSPCPAASRGAACRAA